MTCRRRDDVGALLLGALPDDDALELEAHILDCEECAAQRRELSIVRTLLDTFDPSVVDEPPAEVGDRAVARMVATAQHDRRRDIRMVLLGAAAALAVVFGAFGVVRWRSSPTGAQDLALVAPSAAPDAWAQAKLHPRGEGTIVDLEAGDLPVDGADYVATVKSPDAVLASQTFTVADDGWAQILLATTRPIQDGDVIEIARIDDGAPVTVFRCECSL